MKNMNNKLEEQTEVFKAVPSLPGIEVSNLGNVKKTLKDGEVIITKGDLVRSTGYYNLSVWVDGKNSFRGVHSLVIEAFTGKISSNKMHVNHINFIKTDNRLSNLELVTARENTNKKHIPSTSEYVGVSANGSRWNSSIHAYGEKKYLGCFEEELEASQAYEKELAKINAIEAYFQERDNRLQAKADTQVLLTF